MFKQDIGTPIGIDPVPIWGKLILYFFESKWMKNSVSLGSSTSFKYFGTGIFLDDTCIINGVNEFSNSFKYVYPKELELKIGYQGTCATFP